MRSLVASFILLLFLFNILGYGGLLIKLQTIAGERFIKRVDSNVHDLGGAMTVKVPFGGYVEPDFMVNSEIERDGDIFRVINQRQYLDTLYLVCIKDDASSKIGDVLHDFVQSFAGDDHDNQNLKSDLTKDYLTTLIGLSPVEYGWEATIGHNQHSVASPESFVVSLTHPPATIA